MFPPFGIADLCAGKYRKGYGWYRNILSHEVPRSLQKTTDTFSGEVVIREGLGLIFIHQLSEFSLFLCRQTTRRLAFLLLISRSVDSRLRLLLHGSSKSCLV